MVFDILEVGKMQMKDCEGTIKAIIDLQKGIGLGKLFILKGALPGLKQYSVKGF